MILRLRTVHNNNQLRLISRTNASRQPANDRSASRYSRLEVVNSHCAKFSTSQRKFRGFPDDSLRTGDPDTEFQKDANSHLRDFEQRELMKSTVALPHLSLKFPKKFDRQTDGPYRNRQEHGGQSSALPIGDYANTSCFAWVHVSSGEFGDDKTGLTWGLVLDAVETNGSDKEWSLG
jgi:hypothetical protein